MSLKKIIVSLVLALTTFSCAEVSQDLIQESDSISISSKNTSNVFSLIKQVNAEYEKRNPELIKLKYQYMSESPFAFYRATTYLFYKDVFSLKPELTNTVKVKLQGDAHLENLGTYQDLNGNISYDLNDFDDVFDGAYTLDLTRLAVSIQLAAQENGINESSSLVSFFLDRYYENLKFLDKNKALINQNIPSNIISKQANKVINKVSGYKYSDFVDEMTSDGKLKLSDKVKPISKEVYASVVKAIENYSTTRGTLKSLFKVKDVAYYISGKGSLGRYRYMVLLEGSSNKNKDDLIIELKEAAQPSVSIVGGNIAGNQAQRVVEGTKYFVTKPDQYYGVTKIGTSDYFIRQVFPNEKVNLEKLDNNSDFKEHLNTVAYVFAKAHAKSNKILQLINDEKISKPLIANYSEQYFAKVKSDFNSFKSALN
jgi:uncharacterized protein (DUF2252 family)